MNTEKFTPASLAVDPPSRGFSVQEVSELSLKKLLWRSSTSAQVSYINEPYTKPIVLPDQIMSDTIPNAPPNDFVTLTDISAVALFGLSSVDELTPFKTYFGDSSQAFSIQQSLAYPYLFKLNYAMLRPWPANPDLAFSGICSKSNVNILDYIVPYYLNNGAWRGTFCRTSGSGMLSRNGTDIIRESQLSFLFENGFFTSYEKDTTKYSTTPISAKTPPAATCYLYKGGFGFPTSLDAIWRRTLANPSNIYYSGGTVMIGESLEPRDPTLALDTIGTARIDNILTNSLETLSDRRLKSNIIELTPNLDVLSIGTYSFNYNSTPTLKEIGFIAQEVEKVIPEIVREHDGMKAVQYDKMGVLLLPIVREQQKRIQNLENQLLELRGLVGRLFARIM